MLYRYFADKDQLHAAVGQWGADEVLARVVPPLLADVPIRERIERCMTPTWRRSRSTTRSSCCWCGTAPAGSDPLADGKARIAAALARVLGDALRELDIDAAGAEPWAQSVVGLGLTTGEWWLERRTMSRAAVSRYLAAFVWHALEGATAEAGRPISTFAATGRRSPVSRAGAATPATSADRGQELDSACAVDCAAVVRDLDARRCPR